MHTRPGVGRSVVYMAAHAVAGGRSVGRTTVAHASAVAIFEISLQSNNSHIPFTGRPPDVPSRQQPKHPRPIRRFFWRPRVYTPFFVCVVAGTQRRHVVPKRGLQAKTVGRDVAAGNYAYQDCRLAAAVAAVATAVPGVARISRVAAAGKAVINILAPGGVVGRAVGADSAATREARAARVFCRASVSHAATAGASVRRSECEQENGPQQHRFWVDVQGRRALV